MPFKVWAIGEEVLSADFQPYIQDQVVATFPSTAARDAAITAPKEGQLCYVTATKRNYQWNGAAWVTPAVQPLGIIAHGTSVANPGSPVVLPLSVVDSGPASWLAANTVTLPAGAAGLYLISLAVNYVSSTTAAVGFSIRNAAGADSAPILNLAGMVATGNPRASVVGSWLKQCADADTFRIYNSANPIAAGDARVDRFSLLRVGDSLAAGVSLLPGPPNEPTTQPA